MFKKIPLLASLLFFLLESNVFASSSPAKENTKLMEPTLIDYIVPVSVSILLLVGIACYWLIFRRKHVKL